MFKNATDRTSNLVGSFRDVITRGSRALVLLMLTTFVGLVAQVAPAQASATLARPSRRPLQEACRSR